jgi:hypothetical protein
MSVLLTVPVLGAVCGMLCEPGAAMRAHRSHAAGVHQAAGDARARGHHHADSSSVNTEAAHHHHAAAPLPPAAEAPRPSAEWNGLCCDQPTLTLATMPVVRHELQIDPAVFDSAVVVLSGSDVRPADLWRHTARPPSLPRHTNPVLRV